ncbi:MAG: transglycosylase SLT domain-containing protein [Gammaproteobacteria bacterium]|nr:transglycosylase SLT domain-containing protein [Gammaproteobacteria bacterium]
MKAINPHSFFQYHQIILPLVCAVYGLLFFTNTEASYENPIEKLTHQAEQGSLTAQVELATAYEHGEGISKNPEKAVQWYCEAALKGSTEAQRNLAWMFLNARGIEKNEALAVRWFKAAAKSGDEYSNQILSRLDKNLQTRKTICIARPTPYWKTKKCSKSCKNTVKIVHTIAPGFNIEPQLVLALIKQESNFKTNARSHKGAIGLMQLMPDTAKRFGVKEIWDPRQNIKGGIRYLSWLLKRYQGDVALALAGYNAGENAVTRYNGIPPYKETQNYVKRIMKVYGKTHHPYEKNITMITQ